MSLRYGILGLLNYGPSTGYEINTFFKESLSFFWQAQTSQIYRELTTLEKNGLAKSEIVIQYGKPNKKVYTITNDGYTAFVEWLGTSTANDSFLMRIFFAAELEIEQTMAMLKKYIDEKKNALAEMEKIPQYISESIEFNNKKRHSEIYWNIAADFGYRNNKVCIEWAQAALEKLDGLE